MPIGVGAALLIGSAVGAGTQLAGAKIQSNAASKAQKSQQAATNQALAVQQQALSPYQNIGAQGLAQLGQARYQPYTQVFGNGAGAQPSSTFQPQSQPSLAGIGGQPQPQGMAGQGAPWMAPQGGAQGGQMVRLRAPTGEIAQMPANSPQLALALQRGAVRI